MTATYHILVADDDATSRLYFARQLRQPNQIVTTVETGREAIDRLQEQPFDLILLDILMPNLNGFKVLECLKADPTLRHIPVVMVSNLDDLDSLIRCIELGAEDYLFKPLNPVLLQARINACLERKRLRDQEQAYLEDLRAERDAAASANRAKSAFLANMSHELRTPLNAIIGYSDILQEEIQDLAAELIPDLDKIRTSGRHLLYLVDDILNLAKMEAGKMDLYLETINLPDLIDDVVQTIQPIAAQRHNSLQVSYPATIGTMHADRGKVRQILLNLLSNASKFTENGIITLTVRRKEERGEGREEKVLEHQKSGDSVLAPHTTVGVDYAPASPLPPPASRLTPHPSSFILFSISDTGIGIDRALQDTIFQIFHQGDNSPTRRYGGTGLGLALTQRFCEMMGGSIGVNSTLGEGSTFTVTLPIDVIDHHVATALATTTLATTTLATAETSNGDGQPQPLPLQSSSLPEAASLVLVIDDDRVFRDLMVQTLNSEGFRVVTTWSGEEGLRLARELRPDLILLDLIMPGMDSWIILSALNADPNLTAIPVLLTANGVDRSLTLGISNYLLQPTDFKRLALLLQQYRRQLSQTSPLAGQILLVAEDGTTRQIVQRLLQKDSWIVTATGDTRTVLEQLAHMQPDLILLDLMPPDLKGLALLAELRQSRLWHDLPIVILTAKDLTKADRARLNQYTETHLQLDTANHERSLKAIRKLAAPYSRPNITPE